MFADKLTISVNAMQIINLSFTLNAVQVTNLLIIGMFAVITE